MKETEGFSIRLFAEKCKGKQGRARLAAAVGLLAMLLILLSELFPQPSAAGSTQKAKSAQSSTEYQAQLEERLERLISHMSGAGKTTVMVTLGGNDLCIGHAVRRYAVAADACLAGGWFCPDGDGLRAAGLRRGSAVRGRR